MKFNEWNLKSSDFGKLTLNPLRVIYERNIPEPNPEKSVSGILSMRMKFDSFLQIC
jgi:hypothetical protein